MLSLCIITEQTGIRALLTLTNWLHITSTGQRQSCEEKLVRKLGFFTTLTKDVFIIPAVRDITYLKSILTARRAIKEEEQHYKTGSSC